MPDNTNNGALENFLVNLVPQFPNPLYDHVKASVAAIPDQRFSDGDEPKARIHTWLAWQEEPGRPYGTAIKAGFLDAYANQVDGLVNWLNGLFP